jgi:hypothetical protein
MELKALQNSLKVCLLYPEFRQVAEDIEVEILRRIRHAISNDGIVRIEWNSKSAD